MVDYANANPDDAWIRRKSRRTHDEEEDRNDFIKKVYGIVWSQLAVTSLITYGVVQSPRVQLFILEHPEVSALCTIVMIVV